MYVKAILALYGSIIFWYGAWTFADVGLADWSSGAIRTLLFLKKT